MPDVFSKAKRSQIMAAIHSRGNKETELKLAAIMRVAGVTGWRRHQPLLGRPDFVFHGARLAVFVDGCFWHGCHWHCRMPQDNREYWQRKISRTAARDRNTNRLLRRAGWRVLRFWSHSLRCPDSVIRRIQMSARHQAEAEAIIHGDSIRYGTVFRRVWHGKSMAELRTDGMPQQGNGMEASAFK